MVFYRDSPARVAGIVQTQYCPTNGGTNWLKTHLSTTGTCNNNNVSYTADGVVPRCGVCVLCVLPGITVFVYVCVDILALSRGGVVEIRPLQLRRPALAMFTHPIRSRSYTAHTCCTTIIILLYTLSLVGADFEASPAQSRAILFR